MSSYNSAVYSLTKMTDQKDVSSDRKLRRRLSTDLITITEEFRRKINNLSGESQCDGTKRRNSSGLISVGAGLPSAKDRLGGIVARRGSVDNIDLAGDMFSRSADVTSKLPQKRRASVCGKLSVQHTLTQPLSCGAKLENKCNNSMNSRYNDDSVGRSRERIFSALNTPYLENHLEKTIAETFILPKPERVTLNKSQKTGTWLNSSAGRRNSAPQCIEFSSIARLKLQAASAKRHSLDGKHDEEDSDATKPSGLPVKWYEFRDKVLQEKLATHCSDKICEPKGDTTLSAPSLSTDNLSLLSFSSRPLTPIPTTECLNDALSSDSTVLYDDTLGLKTLPIVTSPTHVESEPVDATLLSVENESKGPILESKLRHMNIFSNKRTRGKDIVTPDTLSSHTQTQTNFLHRRSDASLPSIKSRGGKHTAERLMKKQNHNLHISTYLKSLEKEMPTSTLLEIQKLRETIINELSPY